MVKESFYTRNRSAIFCLCIIASLLIVAIPQGVMCTGLFANETASTNAVNAFCEFFSQWAWLPFIVFFGIAMFVHNTKAKVGFLISAGFVVIAYVVCKNIDVIRATADEIVLWFSS